jgi:hypothetical protein
MLQDLTTWLEGTWLHALFSDTTQLATWLIIPISQSVHIVAVSVVMISVGVLNLRLLGVAGLRQSFAQRAAQLIPWIWGALGFLLLTGTVQTIAEPTRELMNNGFRLKMVLLLITAAITAVYQRTAASDPNYWELSPERRTLARALASLSLAMWLGIAVLGRLIAYWT